MPVNDAEAGIEGTTYEAESPSYLRFSFKEEPEELIEESGVQADEAFEEVIDFGEEPEESGDETLFDFEEALFEEEVSDAEQVPEVDREEPDDIILDIDDLDTAESTLDELPLEPEIEEESPPIDFGDLDISDLQPPEDEEISLSSLEEGFPAADDTIELGSLGEDLILEEEVQEEAAPAGKPSGGQGLEDLLLDELDLDKIEKPVVAAQKTKSVKTGTALDSFDIDLGELFTEDK